jgi:hypothetical protein
MLRQGQQQARERSASAVNILIVTSLVCLEADRNPGCSGGCEYARTASRVSQAQHPAQGAQRWRIS